MNEKGAILHYTNKRAKEKNGHVLLIDAGASKHGYASDITRTYVSSSADPVFANMVRQLDEFQKQLCQQVTAGTKFETLHHNAHLMIARILIDNGVIIGGLNPEESVQKKLTWPFFCLEMWSLMQTHKKESNIHLCVNWNIFCLCNI